jgi:curli production assembly/transport component CsgF
MPTKSLQNSRAHNSQRRSNEKFGLQARVFGHLCNLRSVHQSLKKWLLSVAILVLMPCAADASDQKFSFNLPSFGGNPLASTYYLSLLESQKKPKEPAEEQSTIDAFTEDLERRLLSSLASDVVSNIFSDNASESGAFSVGGLDVSFETVNGDVIVTISDGVETTEITVPGI